jgi:beta-lactamase regulating signal transducer with metallopeptidase domain
MTPSIVEFAVKSTAIMAVAAVVAGLMRRRGSAASRHLVWVLAVAGVLILPIASIVVPSWEIPIWRATTAAASVAPIAGVKEFQRPIDAVSGEPITAAGTSAAPVQQSRSAVASISWMALLPMAYAAGVVLLLGRLGVEHWKTRRMLSRTTRLDDAGWNGLLNECTASLGVAKAVRLVRSREEVMPMACGLLRPAIVIPSIAELWDEDRRRAVLLHELAHVVRFDCLTQTLAEVAVALYWAHPGTWWMARRLRVERELSCDDCVLASGTEPREYAGHLLEIAHSLGGYRAPALAVSMARPQELEGRMLAMLDATRNRATPATSRRLFALALAAVVVTPLAAVTTVAVPAVAAASNARGALGTTPAAPAELRASPQAQDRAATSVPAGTWQIRLASDGRSAHLTISVGEHSFHSTTIPLDRVEGLAAILTGPGGPAHYSLKREAGTFDFEGTVRSGVGGGTFSFAPSTTFTAELVKRGFAKPTLVEQGTLAWADIGFAFLDELEAQKYSDPTLQQLVNGAKHGVTRAYLREMSDLGYHLGSIDALIRLRDHGVDSGFVRDMQALGFKSLTADDAVRARDHGIDAGYARALREVGYGGLSLDQLVDARNHGIDADYARGLRSLGYSLSLAQLVDARNHGIDPDYVSALRQLGYQLTLEELIAARNHGVDSGYINEMASAGYQHPTIADLIRMRDHGINAKTVQQLKSRGVDRPSIDRLIELHDRGARADPALIGPQLRASKSLVEGLQVVLRDADAAVQRWADRWLK